MEKPQLVQKLSGKEFVDHLAIPELESTKLLQQQLSSGGANTALHIELPQTSLQPENLQAAYSEDELEQTQLCTMSFQQLSLQQDSLQITFSEEELGQTASTRSFGQQSLQQNSLQAAYSIGSFQTSQLDRYQLEISGSAFSNFLR